MAEITDEVKEQMLEEAYSVTPNYDIDYNDKRFGNVETEKQQALTQLEQTYGGVINNADKYYQEQIDATQAWADKQSQLQQEQTDFAIEKIEQQKEQARKDYLKEQSASYVDWQKQSNKYGTEAEKIASAGLTSTGFSESSQVSMYNTYQLRVAMARESLTKANLEYDNAIKDAFLQNNAKLAEIAYTALQKKLELSLQGFQYKNNLILEQANKKIELDDMYYNRYQDVLEQINKENAMKEEIRQYTDTQKWNTEQAELEREFKSEEARIEREFQATQAEIERKYKTEQAEIDRKHEKEMLKAKTAAEKEILAQQHKNDLAKLEKQKQNELAILNQQLANEKALASYENSLAKQSVKITGGSSGSSGVKITGSSGKTSSSSGSSGSSGVRFAASVNNYKKYEVSTAYYQGAKNPDASKYGTFSNGYQPKGISGHGTLSKTGETIQLKTQTLSGQKQTVVQNVWEASDGTKWYWEGRQNKYIKI